MGQNRRLVTTAVEVEPGALGFGNGAVGARPRESGKEVPWGHVEHDVHVAINAAETVVGHDVTSHTG